MTSRSCWRMATGGRLRLQPTSRMSPCIDEAAMQASLAFSAPDYCMTVKMLSIVLCVVQSRM
jgi:hypothetical protein